jgi:hypothetical protein
MDYEIEYNCMDTPLESVLQIQNIICAQTPSVVIVLAMRYGEISCLVMRYIPMIKKITKTHLISLVDY